jgi:hypothetical protein
MNRHPAPKPGTTPLHVHVRNTAVLDGQSQLSAAPKGFGTGAANAVASERMPRTRNLHFRLTRREYDVLVRSAAATDQTLAEFVRSAIRRATNTTTRPDPVPNHLHPLRPPRY